MAAYEEERLISDFDDRYLPPQEKEAIPQVLDGLRRHEQAVARNARAVDRQLNGLQTTITNLERQLQETAAELNGQIDNLVQLVDRIQQNNDANEQRFQQHQEEMQQQLNNQCEDMEERLEHRLEQNNATWTAATRAFDDELINIAERIDTLEDNVRQLAATSEQMRIQMVQLEANEVDLSSLSLGSDATDEQAQQPAQPSLAEQLEQQQYERLPENAKVLHHMVQYLRDIQAENPEYDQQHPLVELRNELEPVLDRQVGMLPLQVINTPAYDGNPKTSIFKFLEEVEDDINTNTTFPLTEGQKVLRLRSHLRGRARQYFDSVPNANKQTFGAACDVLKRKFNDKLVKRLADARLTSCYQKPDESIHAFSERLMDILNTVMEGEPVAEIEKASNREFKHRLIPRIRIEVLRVNPDTYEESLGTALQYEAYQDELKVINQMNPETAATIMVADIRNAECFYCHKIGHLKAECYQRQRDEAERNWQQQGGYQNKYRGRGGYQNNNRNRRGYQGNNRNRGGYRNNNGYNNQNQGGNYGGQYGGGYNGNNRQNYNNNGNNFNNFNNSNDYRNNNGNNRRADSPFPRSQQASRSNSAESVGRQSRPAVRFSAQTMPLYTIFILALFIPFIQAANQPMLCLSETPSTLWTLVKDPVCISADWITEQPIIPANFKVYRQNTIEYSTEAVHCKCVSTTVLEWTSFFGTFHHTETVKNLRLTTNDCMMMKSTNESRAGLLQQHDGYLGTNNTAVPDTPIWPLSMVSTQAYAENCFTYTTKIFTRYGIPEIQSAFIAAAECRYQKGACNMEEDGVLLWQPDVTQNCKFIELAVWNGSFSSGVWIAENQDFALSFEEATAIQDCNITVVLADQGFAVEQQQLNETIAKAEQPRAKRDVGIVYSSQLAAEMTALQERTMQTTRKMFTATLHQICSTLNAIAEATLALATANPTLLARQMLNETNIKARLVSARILEITACLPMDPAEVHFSPQEQCYNRLPVKFMFKHQAFQAFLDPVTLILENHADAVPCDSHEDLYLNMNKIQKFNQRTGHAEFVDVQHEITTFKTIDFPPLAEHGHGFKNLILANLSEVFQSNTFFKSSAKVQHMQMVINKISGTDYAVNQQYQPHLDAYAAHVVSTGIFAFLYGGIKSVWQIWIFTCCVYITIHFMMHVLFPSWIWEFVKYLNIFNLIQKIKNWCDKRPRKQARWTPSTNDARVNMVELEEMLTTCPEPRFSKIQQKWPSTTIEVPQRQLQRSNSSILAISNEGRSPAHVQGTLDGNPCFYLLDTGAKRSIVNKEYVARYGIKTYFDQPDIQLMGIEGRPVVTNGYIKAEIQLAQIKIQLNLFIFPGPNRLLCASDVILGEDAFQKLPIISFDYRNKEVYFGQNAALLMVDSEQSEQPIELQIGKTDANEEQQQQLFQVLTENIEAISMGEYDIGKCTLTLPTIEMLDKSPMVIKTYRVPEKHKQVIKDFINEMLKADLIEETTSPWLSNLLVVPKQEDKESVPYESRSSEDREDQGEPLH